MVDNIQWSIGGIDNSSADERSDEAQSGGLWVDQSKWVATSSDTTRILLTDASAGIQHSPADYLVLPDFAIDSVQALTNGGIRMEWRVPNHTEVVVFTTTNLLVASLPVSTNAIISGATVLANVAYTNASVDSAVFFSLRATVGH